MLSNAEIYEVLQENKVDFLVHANTVTTALTFLEHGGLCSREYVEKMGWKQTPQKSDFKDKKYGIYNDIFFDSDDIHKRAGNINFYGPVEFVYSSDIILQPCLKDRVFITKSNPIYWEGEMPVEKRYFINQDELRNSFRKGNFGQSITCRNLCLLNFDCLRGIIIDQLPSPQFDIIFSRAFNALSQAVNKICPDKELLVRNCPARCRCMEKYANMDRDELKQKFYF